MASSIDEEPNVISRVPWIQFISILIIGLGIGWLAGLSVSPVISGILTSLIGIGAGIVVGSRSFKIDSRGSINPIELVKLIDARPAAILVIGISIASTFGILTRTYHILEPNHRNIAVSIDDNLSQNLKANYTLHEGPQDVGGLFAINVDECNRLLGHYQVGNYEAFLGELRASQIPAANELASRFENDIETLIDIVEILCKYNNTEK